MCAVELSSGQLASCVLHHWPSRDLKGLQDRPSCLAELLENWKRLTRMKWAWHLVTSTFILRGKRGTWRHQPSFCGAGVALMALGWIWWRGWCLVSVGRLWLRGTSSGRPGTWRHQPSFCGEGAALGDIDANTQTSTQTSFTHTFHTQPWKHISCTHNSFTHNLVHTQSLADNSFRHNSFTHKFEHTWTFSRISCSQFVF